MKFNLLNKGGAMENKVFTALAVIIIIVTFCLASYFDGCVLAGI